MRGHADLMDDRGDHGLDIDLLPALRRLAELAVDRGHLVDALGYGVQLARLRHKILHTERRGHPGHILRHEPRQHQRCRRLVHLPGALEDRDAVQLRQHQIQNQHIRFCRAHQLDCALTVGGGTDDLVAGNLFQPPLDVSAEFLVPVCDQNFDTVFHLRPLLVIWFVSDTDFFIAATTIL